MDPFTPFNSSIEDRMEIDRTLILRNVRLSYPHLQKPYFPQTGTGGKPKYGAKGIANLTSDDRKKIGAIIQQLIKSQLGANGSVPADRWFVTDGNVKGGEENKDCLLFSANEDETRPPKVYGRDGRQTNKESEVYAGCMVDIQIRPWVQANKWGKRVNAGLVAVKFVGDNTPFGVPAIDSASALGGIDDPNLPAPSATTGDPGAAPGFEHSPEPPTSMDDDDFNPFA